MEVCQASGPAFCVSNSLREQHLPSKLPCDVQIRSVIAKEMIQDLSDIAEENSLLMRETIKVSFSLDNVTSHPLDSSDTV